MDFDVPGDFQAAVRFQQAYAMMAFLHLGIPVGDPIILTGDQDQFLCSEAVAYLRSVTL